MSAPPRNDFVPFGDEEFARYAPPPRRPPAIPGIVYCDEPPRWGGFGTVFKAHHTRLNCFVALKVADQPTEDAAEAVHLARYQHPNIVTVHDTDQTDDGRRYVLLEWLDGGSLSEHLARGARLSARGWAELFEKLALAVDAVHTAGALHRDIKPSNILFVSEKPEAWFRQPKLADFGLAVDGVRASDGSGTRAYMAPEQRGGNPTRFSDVYSLGLTLLQCLTGFQPRDDGELPEPLPTASMHKTLSAIVEMCLSKEPCRRYATPGPELTDPKQRPALELAFDLRRFLNHYPTRARPLHRVQRIGLWVWRSPWQAAAFAALGLGLIFSGWFAYRESEARQQVENANSRLTEETDAKLAEERRATEANKERLLATQKALKETRRANILRYATRIQKAQEHIRLAESVAAIAELEGCDPTLRGWEWDYLRSRCDGTLLRVKLPLPVQSLATGSGGRLAAAVWGGSVYSGEWNEKFAETPPFREPAQRAIRRMFLSPERLLTTSLSRRSDTKVIASAIAAHPIMDQRTIETVRELFGPGTFVGDEPAEPVLAPDGRVIVFPSEEGRLKCLDLESGRITVVSEKLPPVTALAFRSDKPTLAAIVGDEVHFWAWGTGSEHLSATDRPRSTTLSPQRQRLHDLGFTADGMLVLVGEGPGPSLWALDGVWKLAERQPADQRKGIKRLVTNPATNAFVTAGATLTVWTDSSAGADAPQARDLLSPTDRTDKITAVTLSEDGKRVFSGDAAGGVREFNVDPDSEPRLAFASEFISLEYGVSAGIKNEQVELNGRVLALGDVKPRGLRLESRPENGATRLLVDCDQRRVVLDVETGDVVLSLTSSLRK